MPFTTVSSLVTALLTELKKTYVTSDEVKDKKMRKRIKKTIEIVNSYHEMSNLIIKGNPFKHKKLSEHGDSVEADTNQAQAMQSVIEEENSEDTSSGSDVSSVYS